MEVRLRFAPSPTGPLHIGGVRTALYNYLFAKKNKGKFILRIEDTDQTRFVEGAEEYIKESMNWLGLAFDEGPGIGGEFQPYKQSERKEIYKQYADYLLENEKAYLAFDTAEELDQKRAEFESEKKTFKYDSNTRKEMNNSLTLTRAEVDEKIQAGEAYVIRILIPENEEIVFNDIIRGEVRFHSRELDDKVIFKSDGLPTYHLANVVDDHLMKISHVIRGEEWLPSAPLHVLLYRYLGWEENRPQFAHMPLILKPAGKGKLSKRDGDKGGFPVFPLEWKDPQTHEISSGYRESGYFPEAVCNILAFLGWNPGTEQEIFSMDELIQSFSLERVGKSGAKFDPEKAKWFNHQYMQMRDPDELSLEYNDVLIEKGIEANIEFVTRVVELVRERASFIEDLWEQSWFFFRPPDSYDEKVVKKRWKENSPQILKDVVSELQSIDVFTSGNIEEKIKTYLEKNELGFGQVMNVLRLCLVGSGMGPHLFDIAELIGKEESLKRIQQALDVIK
jgi:glutamyl-tRNA synthetase